MELFVQIWNVEEIQNLVVNGATYVKQTFVAAPVGEKKQIAFTLFGEKVVSRHQGLQVGDFVRVRFTIESRNWQGAWYTDVRATYVEKMVAQPPTLTAEERAEDAASAPTPDLTPTKPVSTPIYKPEN